MIKSDLRGEQPSQEEFVGKEIGVKVFMKGKVMCFRNLAACLLLLLGNAATGDAAPTLNLVPAGNCIYSLQGTGFNRVVATTDVVIQYDSTSLTNPRVTWGNLASGYPLANTGVAGQIHLVAIDRNTNASAPAMGTFATITFDPVGQTSGNIIAKANLTGINYAKLSAEQVSTLSIANTCVTPSAQNQDAGSGSGGGSGGNISTAWLGGVTMPTDGTATTEKAKEELSPPIPEPVQEKERPVAAAYKEEPLPDIAPVHPEPLSEKKSAPVKSVLEQFQLFKGERKPEALMALFKSVEGIAQEPPVALSDGTAKVKASVAYHPSGKQAPNFSLKGAKLVSFKMEGDSAWVIELIPDKGACKSTIMILQDGGIKEIPLTVAPPLPADGKTGGKGKLTRADFILFLKERGTEKAPRFDLNGDGKRDYTDDYIFTANFIAQNGPDMKYKANTKKESAPGNIKEK